MPLIYNAYVLWIRPIARLQRNKPPPTEEEIEEQNKKLREEREEEYAEIRKEMARRREADEEKKAEVSTVSIGVDCMPWIRCYSRAVA